MLPIIEAFDTFIYFKARYPRVAVKNGPSTEPMATFLNADDGIIIGKSNTISAPTEKIK